MAEEVATDVDGDAGVAERAVGGADLSESLDCAEKEFEDLTLDLLSWLIFSLLLLLSLRRLS